MNVLPCMSLYSKTSKNFTANLAKKKKKKIKVMKKMRKFGFNFKET